MHDDVQLDSSGSSLALGATGAPGTSRAAVAATIWSLAYGAAGVYWALGGPGYPYGPNDPGASLNVLGGVSVGAGAQAFGILGLIGAGIGLLITQAIGRGRGRLAILAFAWATAATAVLIVPDYRVLTNVAYTPIFVVGAAFGWLSIADYLAAFTWAVVNQFLFIAGGLAWAVAAIRYSRVTSAACGRCGRSEESGGWTTAGAAARWGRWATAVAVVMPLLYAATRWAWALGIPLGISEGFLRWGQESGLWVAGASLATIAAAGGLLTLGLSMRWGEVFPAWMPLIGGKVVPIRLAVVPAMIVAALVTSAGVMFVRLALSGGFDDAFDFVGDPEGNWAAIAPELLWPLWGLALGAAALAYAYRRRGRCPVCGRG